MRFVVVAPADDVPLGRGRAFTVADKDIAVFNVDGAYYAIDDSCRHQGSSLASGKLDGKVVTCPGHGWRYDVTTGSTLHVPGYGVSAYPVKIENGQITIELPA